MKVLYLSNVGSYPVCGKIRGPEVSSHEFHVLECVFALIIQKNATCPGMNDINIQWHIEKKETTETMKNQNLKSI